MTFRSKSTVGEESYRLLAIDSISIGYVPAMSNINYVARYLVLSTQSR